MIHKKTESLFLIDLDQNDTGFRKFIASWLFRNGNKTVLIDPGPLSTIPVLVDALKKLDVHHLDHILLTHIHIDHAGGTGALLKHFTDTPVLCHPKGIPHLIDPGKLWEGTQKVLGDMATLYGPIVPVPEKNLYYSASIAEKDLSVSVIETPGHAAHHLSFCIEDLLFAGEALGVSVPEDSGSYLRPATPPVFIHEIYRDSIEKLKGTDTRTVCFGHYGMKPNPGTIISEALKQLEIWMEVLETHTKNHDILNTSAIIQLLIERDASFRTLPNLPSDIRRREIRFTANSLQGMHACIQKKKTTLQVV